VRCKLGTRIASRNNGQLSAKLLGRRVVEQRRKPGVELDGEMAARFRLTRSRISR
jgi:hypothetical protein